MPRLYARVRLGPPIYNLGIQRRSFILGILPAIRLLAQTSPAAGLGGPPSAPPVEFVCPMHPDVRSPQPGVCPRCGMKLVANLPERVEYRLKLALEPRAPLPGKELQMAFTVTDPRTGQMVTDFQVMHEKLYHLFIVSQDLKYFVHDHPVQGQDGVFRFKTRLPEPGMYRVLSDFYPTGGTPQLIVKSIVLPGRAITPGTKLAVDLGAKDTANMRVSLTMQPEQPIAGMKTLMFFNLEPGDGLEPYLGAWSHMLAASDDLIDMIHDHPVIADGGPQMQFNLIFPRARTYKVWVQFQRKGVVNTAEFNVPVTELR
ncbi:MAG TPA: heavy metal-binding domain-containing protein [Candidatus Angelobacter sp.]|nr:heavy metal-binding domain-containing protein [Candidatus Angelobacter sp.]